MSLARYQFTVTDTAGNVLPAAAVTVRREVAGSPLANLFSDREGATPLGNPMAADADGFAAFHVAGGAYQIVATSGAFSRTWRYVGIGLASESDSLVTGIAFAFDSATADADPGPGLVRLNNATLASVTQIFFDNLASLAADVSAWLDSFDDAGGSADRGQITLQTADGTGLFIATVTGSVTDGTGYRKVSVTPISTAGSFTAGEAVLVSFSRAAQDGIDGVTAGTPFNFDSSTSMADPGAGDFRLNNATLSSVTAAAIDDQSAASGNPDVSAFVLTWDDGSSAIRGHLIIRDTTAPENFAVFTITGASTDNAGWTQLALTYVTHAGAFTNGNACSLEFVRGGDAGTVVGKQSIWIPASAMLPRITSGAGVGVLDTGAADNTIPVLDFDQTSAENAQFSIAMPKSWNESTVTFTPYWTADAGTAAQTFILQMTGAAVSNDDPLNATMGSAASSSDTLIATGDLHIGPESGAVTIGGTPAEGDLVIFTLTRDVTTDTLAADARLLGIMLHITLNANTDA